MTFKFYCTCGQKVSATEDMIGLAALCPRCGTKIIVTQPSEIEPQPEPPAQPSPTASLAPAPPPLSVVPRPMRLLRLATSIAMAAMLIAGACLFRMHWDQWLKFVLPAFAVVLIGGAIAALFLRLTIRIIAHFDFAYLEAWLVSIVAGACSTLALIPLHFIQPGKGGAEFAIKLLSSTNAASVVLIILAYSFLIRNPQGRPLGLLRGALSALLQTIFIGLVLGLLGGIAAFFWYSSRIQPG